MITYDVHVLIGTKSDEKTPVVKCHDTGVNLRVYPETETAVSKWRKGVSPYRIPKGAMPLLIIKKPDGKHVTTEAETVGDTWMLFDLPPQTFTASGICNAEVSIYSAEGERLTTDTFSIEVPQELIHDGEEDSTSYVDVVADQIANAAKRAAEAGIQQTADALSKRIDNAQTTADNAQAIAKGMDWLAEEGEAGHIKNRTHYQTVSNAPGYMPYDECDVESLGVGTHLVFKPKSAAHFKENFAYEIMRKADPFTYNVDYSCFYPPTGGEISFKYRAEQMVVNTLFTLIDTKNYRLVQFPSGVTAYVILDVGTLAEEYKSKFPEIGIYLDVEESVYTNRRITIQVVRVYRLNELYIPDTIARKTDIPEGGGGGGSNEVYIGSEQPTDEDVKLWVDPSDEPQKNRTEVWVFTLSDGSTVTKTVVLV